MSRFCKDCVHCDMPRASYRDAVCTHPRSTYPDLVSGAAVTPLCDSARISPCGAAGELFEARVEEVAA